MKRVQLFPQYKFKQWVAREEREFDQLFLEFNIQASYTNLRRAVESMYAHIGIRVTGIRLKHEQKRIRMCISDSHQEGENFWETEEGQSIKHFSVFQPSVEHPQRQYDVYLVSPVVPDLQLDQPEQPEPVAEQVAEHVAEPVAEPVAKQLMEQQEEDEFDADDDMPEEELPEDWEFQSTGLSDNGSIDMFIDVGVFTVAARSHGDEGNKDVDKDGGDTDKGTSSEEKPVEPQPQPLEDDDNGMVIEVEVAMINQPDRWTLQVEEDTSIASVKAILQDRTGMRTRSMRLLTPTNREEMEDHRTLSDYGIVTLDTLNLMLTIGGGGKRGRTMIVQGVQDNDVPLI